MRVLVCGGRRYEDEDAVYRVLDSINPSFVIEGGATGADALAADWARENGVPCATVDAHWTFYGKKAGYIRNTWMLMLNPVKVVAFPGGNGTANMIKLAEEAGIEVIKVE